MASSTNLSLKDSLSSGFFALAIVCLKRNSTLVVTNLRENDDFARSVCIKSSKCEVVHHALFYRSKGGRLTICGWQRMSRAPYQVVTPLS